MGNDDERLAGLLAELTLDEKVGLLTGRDFWSTQPIPKIGLRSIVVSDGPSGVRGPVWDERDPSLNLPSATALSSSWDGELAYRYGAVLASEARRKGVDVVLGPTINLHRSPYGGRHFEAFSEDPILTGEIAANYVAGMQRGGVGATPKHYAANDFEADRFTVDVQVSDRALRELYLVPFEKAVTEGRAWLVMSAYNSINGATASENTLLETPLNSEWGFDGVVVSDWTAVRSLNSARYSQDLVMPGPTGPWGDALVAAVVAGEIDEAVVDRKVLRILRLASRVGALDDGAPASRTAASGVGASGTAASSGSASGAVANNAGAAAAVDGVGFVREAAAGGTVMLTNRDELPWSPAALHTVAVVGHNATLARTQGGGSATVLPERVVTPLDGIRDALPNAQVTYSMGAIVQEGIAELPLRQMTNPLSGEPGVAARFLDAGGAQLSREDRRSSALVWFGGDAPIATSSTLELTTTFTPDETGQIQLGFACVGRATITVDDELVLDHTLLPEGDDFAAAFLAPPSVSAPVTMRAGVPIRIRIEVDLADRIGPLAGALAFSFGIEARAADANELIAEAAAAAAMADVALVVVGTNSRVESEGYDRESLALPGRQDDLVRAIAAANPHTVVVVNAGSPVLMPWRDEVAGILVPYFGGQEFGNALADVLLGVAEPGGRLPTTWPAAEADLPVGRPIPAGGIVRYEEGIQIGYRAWLKSGVVPAFPFGHGLGYTSWSLSNVGADVSASVSASADASTSAESTLAVRVSVTNTGDRAGKHVVQVYATRPDSEIERPVRWLAGFTPVWVDSGATQDVTVTVPMRTFAHWADGWVYEPGEFSLLVGSSVDELALAVAVQVDAEARVSVTAALSS